ncbi:hypothetical protein V1477_014550 [Vespula maculifrons]|uniref:Uncharacterized protein n=1 Tax=Vespula maculifrons TaxID=7453 RepID=A0ABD2BHS4_VESMC
MNNSGRPIRTPINLGPRVTHCRGLRLRVELFPMIPPPLKISFLFLKMEIVGERFTSKEYRSLDRTFELIHSPSAVVVYSCDSQSKSVLNRSIQLSRLLEIATLQLKEMEATEEKTRSQRDLAPLPVTLAVRLTKFDISHRSYNLVYPGSFFRPGRRIPLKELLEKRAWSTYTSFHRRD